MARQKKSLKIAISHKIQNGPYGGGNAFVSSLSNTLLALKHDVYFDLKQSDLDFIILTDPRRSSPNVTFSASSILRYIRKNPQTIVIHRINECDERKNTRTMNFRLRTANYCADHTVFVGSWLKNLKVFFPRDNPSQSVILNGGDGEIFHSRGASVWDGLEPLKIVTHHWGGNWMKGFDVYQKLDEMLSEKNWKNLIEFTYIGNLPKGFRFKNANYLEPLSGKDLSAQLKSHHVYVTGSINEPGGNHQIEGGLCGLPLLYRNSGCLPEYCNGYGVMFEDAQIEYALKTLFKNYNYYKLNMDSFPHVFEKTAKQWLELFENLDRQRMSIISQRKKSYLYKILNYLI